MLIAKNISVRIRANILLQNISCTLIPGRLTIFVGKSGAGKTTLLKSLVGLIGIEQGSIEINGKPLEQLTNKDRAQEIGFVFQNFNLFGHLNVLENCIDPLIVQGITREQAIDRARAVLQQMDMQDFVNIYPNQLSGGQQQRVAIARALCLQPKILLLDEPTACLDPINTAALVHILQNLAAQGLTIAVSSQDMQFVQTIFDRAYYLEDGCIVEFCDNGTQLKDNKKMNLFLN